MRIHYALDRAQFAALLLGLGGTVETVNTFFARQAAGAGIEITGGLNQVLGGLTADPSAISGSVVAFQQALNKFSAIFG